MSSKQRRAIREINRLVRMDQTRARMSSAFMGGVFGPGRDVIFWETCMVPVGKKLGRKGLRERATSALELARAARVATGGQE